MRKDKNRHPVTVDRAPHVPLSLSVSSKLRHLQPSIILSPVKTPEQHTPVEVVTPLVEAPAHTNAKSSTWLLSNLINPRPGHLMGAACCRCQHLDDPLLSLPRVSASAMSANLNQFYVPAPLAAASGSASSSSSSLSSSSSASVSQSLANYVSFPFPFVSKPKAEAAQSKRSKSKSHETKPHKPRDDGPHARPAVAPYVGDHWRKTPRGGFAPLTLLELSVRSVCAQLVVHRQDALEAAALPPELASWVLQWLRQHYVLDKPQFQALAPFLLLEWDLADQQDVEDSWFDDIPETTLESVKSIDVSGCIHLQQLGSEWGRHVNRLPELVTASFQACAGLSRESVEMLKFSSKLTALNLSGCINVDDKCLKTLGELGHLKSLQLVGCRKFTYKGVKHLLKLTELEKLRLGRCLKLTDGAFNGFASSFPKLAELDVANCRLSERAMQQIGQIKSLEVLVIRGCQDVSDDGMSSLAELTNLKYFDARYCNKIHSIPTEWTQLQVLLLGYTAFAESDAAVLQYLTKLQELELRKCRIMKRGFQFISRLTQLEHLELGETALTDSGLLEICNGVRNLKALNISNTEVSDSGTPGLAKLKDLRILRLDTPGITNRALANLSFLPHLERLDLFGANITDNGLMHLVPLHKLQELTICGGNIGDRGVGLISKLTSLTSLNLSQNRMQARQENALRRMEQDYDSRMEEQVEDLRDKMRLMQVDRKSNIDLLESSKQTNKDYIRQLKNENRDLRKALADLKRTTSSAGGAGGASQILGTSTALGGGGMADEADEIASAMQQLNKARKQHDDLRHRVQSQTTLLEELKDEVKDLELESKKPSLEDTPETRKIRMLENRLDKAMIKFNEAQSIRKTYEQIVKRLKDERIGFDNQLAAIERALAAKQHDYDELVLLSADAAHARETVLLELEKARSQHEDEKRHRDKELREKQQYVKIRLEMTNRLDKRDKHKGSVVARESGDLSYEGESQLKASLMSTMMQQGVAGEEKKEHRSKIDIFESAFRKIKEATGVSDVNEVIQKITSQESTTDNLLNLSKENQARLERLQAEHAVLKARVEELKYSGSGGGHRRKLVDDHEQNLVLASTKLERAKLKYERMAKVLIGVKAGVEHLVDKMESVREDDQVIVVTDDTIVEALQESEITLSHLLSQIKLAGAAHPSNPALMNSSAMGQQKKLENARVPVTALKNVMATGRLIPEGQGLDADILVGRPYNQRIPLPGTDGLTAEELEMDDMGGAGANGGMLLDDTEEALSRDRVKRASSQVIMAQDKKKKRVLKKKFKESGNDSSDEEGSAGNGLAASTNGGLVGGGSGANQADGSSRGPLTQRNLSPKKK
ncbi:hypothetical protein PHYPSEUDO_007140 [Phytophthora pseudosyringae]|uniref:ODAD1 central coiled coil region domain-containing protein n=1 Tax=Phytophthora pseudosyringae TaxID=221518 RepID=A0A8T1WDE2_9STRA|nr:hypothetical protein PHYPSEUDO_007140 [Phytophthora pseudosyringae]